MARSVVVGGNWKMHLELDSAVALASDVRNRLGSQRGAEVIVFPPFPFLVPVAERLRESRVAIGAQDLWPEAKGAFTGAVSASMLRSVGCEWVLIGHSERRHVFGDDDALVARKLTVAMAEGLKPVLCVGERLEERQAGRTFEVLGRQLDTALAGHTAAALASLVIAYEPVWAIGTGQVATPAQAQEAHAWIRDHLRGTHGAAFADAVRIQYGGSVKGSNAAGLLSQPDIDGALVGGASLQADDFAAIVRARAA
ncbi:MAG: triose-phosphate isomerase [Deltaproteobacteria bacterium]|nr:triose-phosphate isomerase [Deltaproteobacteria bacterium]